TADDIEHFQDWNTAADQLGEGARKPRHANLVHERAEDREFQFPTVPKLFAARRIEKGANPEEERTDSEQQKIPFTADKIADVDQELRRRRQFRAEILEDFAEDRHHANDQEGGNRERDTDDNHRIGHGRFNLL